MRKNLSIIALSMLFLVVIISIYFISLVGGRDIMAGKYPPEKGGKWVSETPNIVLDYTNFEGTRERIEKIYISGEWIDVEVGYMINEVDICKKIAPRTILTEGDELLGGTWKYSDGKLIFTVEYDNIFDSKYTEIVFERESD